MNLDEFKILSVVLIFITTVLAGLYPFLRKFKTTRPLESPAAEALASGVFLGAGLIHMLGDASKSFLDHGIEYPIAFVLAGSVFLLLLWFEHLGRRLDEHGDSNSPAFAILAMVILSIHSLLAGTVLGLSGSITMMVMILIAILAHKWAASFSLAVQLSKSRLSLRQSLIMFALFTIMLPIGVGLGSGILEYTDNYPLLEPIFYSLAAGTFLYLGTLHGLKQSTLVDKCCDLRNFTFVVIGFALMAVVAIWA
ncbi:zinc transporter [Photobacterium iliopiscarium]|jgi:zinc transporter ZupT|uniref:Zinc transporter n=1 Tax=Photobacterium iliopiscarium TaxID=56192 RepID=A0A0D8PZ03_9GAMM|nr:ZIP family metal transporter [Photobacterium iliopiscarium]KJG23795.1 zinc transporter [Photobacterium iliopiscarium]MCD9465568.1 zinc transporter [Photobacterium iliopiscarium]MCD9488963.1 zinc transporter [Photobacterium iliopiscarium]MCF2242209.1 zinc transporter [Photobacterium iliopiscarium]PST95507.1 zinc transporter [Photobacterium iliopiscarium]